MWRHLRVRVGHRGAVLLFFGLLDLVFSLSLWKPTPEAGRTQAIRFIADIAPLWLWATMWGVAGIVLLIGAFLRHDRWAFTIAVALKVLWGSVYLFGWLFAHLVRGWLSATIWLALALMLYVIADWPEPMEVDEWKHPSSLP